LLLFIVNIRIFSNSSLSCVEAIPLRTQGNVEIEPDRPTHRQSAMT